MCILTITSGSVYRIGEELRVSGKVEGCNAEFDTGSVVQVDVTCNGTTTSDFPDVDTLGNWFASVPAGDCKCSAEDEPPQTLSVTVTCLAPATEAPCEPITVTLPLLCFSHCVGMTSDPEGDDVPVVDITWACPPDGGPNAEVNFRFFVENRLPFDVSVRVENPSLVAAQPSPPPVIPSESVQFVEIVATVGTPLTNPNDIFVFTFIDEAGNVVPCPGFERTVTIQNSCCPINEAPRIEVSTNGCELRVSWDPTALSDGCFLHFDFKDPFNPNGQESNPGDSFRVYEYAENGTYSDLSVYVKCENGCSGSPRLFGPVTISGCDEEEPPIVDPTDEPEPESAGCGAMRVAAVVTGAMVIFLLAAAWCLGSIALVKSAALLGIISGILWFFYWLFGCDAPCGVAKLSAAETLIAAGLALLTYSGCCTWQFLLSGTFLLALGLYLFKQWKEDCNLSDCAAWAELARLGVAVTTYLIFVLDLFPGLSACKASIVTLLGVNITGSALVAFITAFTVFKLAACVRDKSPDDQLATPE